MNTTIPVMQQEGFIICFQALPEDRSMYHHFVKECGWTKKEYDRVKNHAWFAAKVSAWRDGVELGASYLGGCCYRTEAEFYTTYKGDYFQQMVEEAVQKAKSKLAYLADPNGSQLKRDHGITRAQLAEIVAQKYTEAYKGKVYCHYDSCDKVYSISGHNLPAHPSVQHVYPNGWSMGTIASEEEAIDIFTGRTKITGIVTVVEVGNVTKDEHGNQGTDAAPDQGRTEG